MPITLELDSPLDMHLHLRAGEMLRLVAPFSAKQFAAAMVMPNLQPPITTIVALEHYRENIEEATDGLQFTPLMTIFLQNQDEKFWEDAKPFITAAKLYPAGVTTNSEGGVSGIDEIEPQLKALEALGIPLCVHGETHGDVFLREREFLPVFSALCTKYPRLKVIFEHISSADGAKLLHEHENLYATITLHHLLYTRDDLMGERLNPHLYCKPVIKTAKDRDALLELALKAHPKVSFGSDSAPHPKEAKESVSAPAGVFSAPVLLPALAELFETHGALSQLQPFVSDNAKNIYALANLPQKTVTLKKVETEQPESFQKGALTVTRMPLKESIKWSI